MGRQPAGQTPGTDVAPPLLLLLPPFLLPPFLCCCWRCWLAGWLAVTPHSHSALGQSTLLCPQSKRLCPGLFCLLRLAQPFVVFPSSQRHDIQSLPPRRKKKPGLTDPVTPVKPHVLEILLVFASLINCTFRLVFLPPLILHSSPGAAEPPPILRVACLVKSVIVDGSSVGACCERLPARSQRFLLHAFTMKPE